MRTNKRKKENLVYMKGLPPYGGRGGITGIMLPVLNTIGTEQATPTKKTEEKCKRLLDYAATCPN